jgi:hypothetical protein
MAEEEEEEAEEEEEGEKGREEEGSSRLPFSHCFFGKGTRKGRKTNNLQRKTDAIKNHCKNSIQDSATRLPKTK